MNNSAIDASVSSAGAFTASEVFSNPAPTWTTAKIQRVALVALEALLIAGAVALYTSVIVSSIGGSGGLALLVFGLGILFISCCVAEITRRSIKDYEDPKELKKYQETCANQSLTKSIEDYGMDKGHGIENMFKYELVSKEQFQSKYTELIEEDPDGPLKAIEKLESRFRDTVNLYDYPLASAEDLKAEYRFIYQGLVDKGSIEDRSFKEQTQKDEYINKALLLYCRATQKLAQQARDL